MFIQNARRWLRRLAWPVYECADCIGMKEHGCQCAAYDAEAPGTPPTRWRRLLRKLVG
jgi:hypothetical protein